MSGSEGGREPARYVVGIDLGTTNSALAYVDSAESEPRVRTLAIPQLVAASTVESLETLPSFLYQPAIGELEGAARALPWDPAGKSPWLVGSLAREQGASLPARWIASAKSWLSHGGVDRTAAILPWHGATDLRRLSPVQVSAAYLQHLREAWDQAHSEFPLAEQDLVVTVPASFDEIARELTVQAAREAGLERIVLIEEPQAAFYAWLDQQEHLSPESLSEQLEPGHRILVADVGGGTTDLSLLRVDQEGESGLRFHRLAVGEHLILGGDNLDLALAHHLESRLATGGKLPPRRWSELLARCRQAKEALLGESPPESYTLTLAGEGSRLVGGSTHLELSREEISALLLDGFVPEVGLDARPTSHASGFREMGLPYAADAGITRYLARFLVLNQHHGRQRAEESTSPAGSTDKIAAVRPDAVLLNGGFFASPLLRQRFLAVLSSWFDRGEGWSPRLLLPPRLDLAVAQGAAYYGMVRRGTGQRIYGGLPRSYYLGSEDEQGSVRALCLVPAGLEEGESVSLEDQRFALRIREPVEFPVYTSATRTTDRPGDLVDPDPELLSALPPVRTVLRSGKGGEAQTLTVQVEARLTEIGTLEVWCVEATGNRRWRLDFDVRAAVETDRDVHLGAGEQAGFTEQGLMQSMVKEVEQTFAPSTDKRAGALGGPRPESLMHRLEQLAEQGRHQWPPSLLRAVWQALAEQEAGRRLGPGYEARWLNLSGFALRPGHGYAADDWRVAQTWRLFHQGPVASRAEAVRAEWWVLWRRLAGGLNSGQQRALFQRVNAVLRGRSRPRPGRQELAEAWRLVAALERLEPRTKEDLGQRALALIESEGTRCLSGAAIWALGRLGARQPLHGPLNTLVSTEIVAGWLERLLGPSLAIDKDLPFAVLLMARRTGDRFRDLPEDLRERTAAWMERNKAPERFRELVLEGGEMEEREQERAFGDSLPSGLRLLA